MKIRANKRLKHALATMAVISAAVDKMPNWMVGERFERRYDASGKLVYRRMVRQNG